MAHIVNSGHWSRGGWLKGLLVMLFIICVSALHAQDATDAPTNSSDPKDTKAQKAYSKKKKEEEKKAEKERKEALKQHLKNQSPEVRKRMKADAKRANRYNEHKGDGFFYKLFHHHKKAKAPSTTAPGAAPQ